MDRRIIIKHVLDDVINKCGVSLKKIKESINPVLKKVISDDNDLEKISDMISHFYKDYSKEDKETLISLSYNNQEFIEKGDENHVSSSDEVRKIGKNEGFLFNIHNHPSNVGFPSIGDFNSYSEMNVRHAVVVAKGGIFIFDNPEAGSDNPFARFFPSCRLELESIQKEKIKEDYSSDFEELSKKYLNKEISAVEAEKSAGELSTKWLSNDKNLEWSTERLNNLLSDEDYEARCYYIPV